MYEREQSALHILGQVGAIITDSHFVYASQKHGSAYVNKDALYPYVGLVGDLCSTMVAPFSVGGIGVNFDVVAGPEKGGIILSQWAAYDAAHLGRKDILAVYAEKGTVVIPDPECKDRKCFAETGKFVFKRGYDQLIAGKQVLVVEDILTTGESVRKVVEAVRIAGGEVIGVSALCDRGNVKPEDVGGVPELHALVNLPLDTWDEADCPMCKNDVPINISVGKGREYLESRRG